MPCVESRLYCRHLCDDGPSVHIFEEKIVTMFASYKYCKKPMK